MDTKDFVTYKQALTLKKIGFRELCLYFYDLKGRLCPNGIYIGLFDCVEDYKNKQPVYIDEGFRTENTLHPNFDICDAPTLVQVQKWLRTKGLNLIVDVNHHNAFSGKYYWKIYNNDAEFVDVTRYGFEIFDSYEDALSAGIKVCLKLLENDKEE